MDTVKAINVLEALASGCPPSTGELIHDDSILSQREVIRALQFAIDHLKNLGFTGYVNVDIEKDEVERVIKLFKDFGRNVSPNNLAGFFLGIRHFQNPNIVSDTAYGSLQNKYTKGQLIDFFSNIKVSNVSTLGTRPIHDYSTVDYFQKEKFNKLSAEAVLQLKSKVNELGVLKTENLSAAVQNARKVHRRAYEAWSEKELELFRKAIIYTNDLDLLSECFQRGKGSIETTGQRLIYEGQGQQSAT